MKQLTKNLFALAAVLCLAGCATYESTVSESEPHAVIRFVRPAESSLDQRTVKKLDGLPVRLGRDYRIAPGNHEVVVRVVETGGDSYSPVTVGAASADTAATVNMSQSGQMTVSGTQPFAAMQPVNLDIESRQLNDLPQILTIEAGWLYEFDGYENKKIRLLR